jgi:DNA-binding transcriptional ArsR family regulator
MSELIKEINQLHAHICQALADPKRILLLYALNESPRNVTQLATDYDIPQPTISRHLKMLKERGLVTGERQGTSIVYSLTDDRVIQALDIMRSLMSDLIHQNAMLVSQMDED